MLPILLNLGVIKIYTNGAFLILSFFWFGYFLWRDIALTSYKEEDVFDGIFAGLFGGLVIGRIAYALIHFDQFGFDLFKYLLVNGYPGINLTSFLIGFILFLLLNYNRKKISFKKIIDYIVPPMLLALGIGYLGGFFSGTMIGTQTNFILSLKYPNLDGTRHLTAFYGSLLFFIGSFISYRILFQIRKEKLFVGFNLIIFSIVYSLIVTATSYLWAFPVKIGDVRIDFIFNLVMLLTLSGYLLYYFRTFLIKLIKLKKLS